VSSVILGVRSVAQLEDNLGAVEVKLPAEVLQKLDELYPRPAGAPQAATSAR